MLSLTGARIILREFTDSDLDAVHAFGSDPEVTRYTTWGPNTIADSRAFLDWALAQQTEPDRSDYILAVTLAATGKVIGSSGLYRGDEDQQRGEIGYVLHRDYWGNGYATEVARLLIDYGFGTLGLHRIEATCDPDNQASAHVLQKTGMIREGRLRDHCLVRGTWRDSLLHAVLADTPATSELLSDGERQDVALTVERLDARQWPEEQMKALFAEGFPAFITADQDAKKYIGRVRDWFPHLNIALVDNNDNIVATGWAIPIGWTGEIEDLPTGYTDATRRAVELREAEAEPDTLVICGAIIHPARKGSGLAGELINSLTTLAGREGWPRVIAPLRPTLKHRYPLATIDAYVTWTRADGKPFDPWLRTHVRLGGRIIATAPESQTMTGTVEDWQTWAEMAFPATGDYVIPGGLSLLRIDVDTDQGVYVEPNVWVQHR